MQTIEIGPAPFDEQCEQANVSGTNYERMKAECNAFLNQLRRVFGPEPVGAGLRVKFNRDGDNGYYEVVCNFESAYQAAIDYAFRCESDCPQYWDAEAKAELANVPTGVQA